MRRITWVYRLGMLLLLLTRGFEGFALIRSRGAAPVLHSIFDVRVLNNNAAVAPGRSFTFYMPDQGDRAWREGRYRKKHAVGVTFLVIGGAFIATAGALFIAGNAALHEKNANPKSEGTPFISYFLPGFLIGLVGVGFSGPGLFLTLRYRKGGKHSWGKGNSE